MVSNCICHVILSTMFMIYLKGLPPPQNETFVINHLPSCCSKPVKALFVFGTQFKIFWMKNREVCVCPIDCQVNNTVKRPRITDKLLNIHVHYRRWIAFDNECDIASLVSELRICVLNATPFENRLMEILPQITEPAYWWDAHEYRMRYIAQP